MEIIQKTKDSLYVMEDGKMIAHIATKHYIDRVERDALEVLMEMLNEA